MRALYLLTAALAFASPATAQYFSEGWKPGKPVPTSKAASDKGFDPKGTIKGEQTQAGPKKSFFDLSTVLESRTAQALFGQFGINITERLAAAQEAASKLWDDSIMMINDENYESTIVNEQLTPEEEKERVWFLVVSVSTTQREGLSKYVDEQFDQAYNLTQIAGDLPKVRWARIDYMNVTALTTRWAIWRAPVLIVLRDRGQSLRFYQAHQIRLNPEVLREFLRVDGWKETQPWTGPFAPGGKREFVMIWFADGLTKVYNFTVLFPRWMIMLFSGTIASALIGLMHRSRGKKEAEAKTKGAIEPKQQDEKEKTPVPKAAPATPATLATPTPGRPGSPRKGTRTDSPSPSPSKTKRKGKR